MFQFTLEIDRHAAFVEQSGEGLKRELKHCVIRSEPLHEVHAFQGDYSTAKFRERFEAAARLNITDSITRLSQAALS